jgi:type I restriction enzyme S subunit
MSEAIATAPTTYPTVPLGEVIDHRKEFITIDDLESYKRCRVQLHAQGIVLRDVIQGAEIRTKKQQVCRAGEFLVAEIDAKIGGFGLVPDDLDGAVVSSHYFLFQINEQRLDKRFLDFFIRTSAFRDQVSAQGSTNYAAIRPHEVLSYQIPLPSISEQRRIVARVEELAGKVEEARGLRTLTAREAEALVVSTAKQLLAVVKAEITELSQWLNPNCDGIQTGPFGAQLGAQDFTDKGVPIITIGNVQYSGLEMAGLTAVFR